ncbi:MAG: adenylate/guanylate cyclase domain-containing protein [Tardiphaga sp.]
MLADEIRKITEQLIEATGASAPPADLIKRLCDEMLQAGIPLWRAGVFIQTLHPDIYGRNFVWHAGGDVVTSTVDFDIVDSDMFNTSALAVVFREGREVRCRLDGPTPYPFLNEMRAEGATDYLAAPLRFIDGSVHATSWLTRKPAGFSDEEIAGIHAIIPPLTRLVEAIGQRRLTTTLLNTYVGSRAGERILGGQIRRGHTETMHAAIWLSDLRGFTALSDRLPPESVVDILNRYFDCQVPAILAHGGEVLKFMGDGLLAVFPVADDGADRAEVCGRVLAAAREARAAVDALRWSDTAGHEERFRFGVALHVGQVLYGNIGGGNRLDFTCIGPAVNLAARLEKIAGRLQRTVVASATFAETCVCDWSDLGEFPIAGFAKAERVYGLLEEDRAE